MNDVLQTTIQPAGRPRFYRAVRDTLVLIRRSLLHIRQDPSELISIVVQPIMFVVLFRYVFGGAINTGDDNYANYLMAGIFVQTAAFGSTTTGVGLAVDLARGIMDRFRCLPMTKNAVLLGHILADLFRSAIAITAMILTGLAVGFRPTADALDWVMAIGLLLLFTFSLSWISAIIGLLGKSVEFAQQMGLIWIFPLTFTSSAFVPPQSMPSVLRVFAENQPITHFVETIRGLLLDKPIGTHGVWALGWCAVILLVAYPVAYRLYRRRLAQ